MRFPPRHSRLPLGMLLFAGASLPLLDAQEARRSDVPAEGSYELRFEGDLSGREIGAARYSGREKLDGRNVLVVQLQTPVLEGGVFIVFAGTEPPKAGVYQTVPAETKGMDGYEKVRVGPGEVAVLYYEMERSHMVLLGSTGKGSVEILESGPGSVRGLIDVEVQGATGNPNAFLSVRPRRATLAGGFDATEDEVEFRKP